MTVPRIPLPGPAQRFATPAGRLEGKAARSHLGGTNVQHSAADGRSERIAKRFEQPLLAAAVLTIPLIILEFLPPADPWREIAVALNC